MFFVNLLATILRAGGILLLSLVLAAIMIGYFAVYQPATYEWMIDNASIVKGWLTDKSSTGLSSQYNVWIKTLVQEQQLVFMALAIIMRVILVILAAIFGIIFNRVRDEVG